MDYSVRPEDEQPIMRVTLTWNGASAEEAGVTHGPCASSSVMCIGPCSTPIGGSHTKSNGPMILAELALVPGPLRWYSWSGAAKRKAARHQHSVPST